MTKSYPPTANTYRQEDIQQILQIAIARQVNDDEFTREQLAEIAAELEITPETLLAAEQDWMTRKGELAQRQQFNLCRQRQFQRKLSKYAIVNTFLVLINIVSAGALTWSLYVLLFWGLGLAMNAWKVYRPSEEEYEQAFQIWMRKHQLKQTVSVVWDRLNRAWQS
ncbi:2TM domain-containing protein [Desertifilum sp. FACHB-1129]|uniref:2TM domain-containing protein n=2 Tax=Desertifilum tharense IPPAS B-1220 TaxID=1781255 RepID=A0A1E5QGU7_9CYAN|nr:MULTISPECIES: 2TM domain-containing protein [Desertifilum]MDA0211869.1 2TM domain-containing protein [Cyanobacteria bacterium FC1]MBD2314287.1 2TM domain-containing protein [Desertifilum sp. FACHB-1129]MBD2320390.1 2TM domain-containing protein [Desertifilum sp. FACHB-866]MBD2330518.1 2TM domain-containing protein [Desertifilum sp. FACHB-868]OEJ73821.1 hypothetical protein BH720_17090 [Desertifilum tharense IPPAS B-1220]